MKKHIKKMYDVRQIHKEETVPWILRKHYAKRKPSISYSYGLYKYDCGDMILSGILTIGKPASPSLCDGVCGKENSHKVYELNRLCVNEGLPFNTLSYFVSTVLKSMQELIIVSYADTAYNHHGYIYQATNWIYTGKTKERTDIGKDDGSHSRHYEKGIDYSMHRKKRSSKHRYIYFTGTKTQKKKNKLLLKYKVHPYPKGDNTRYDSGGYIQVQGVMF